MDKRAWWLPAACLLASIPAFGQVSPQPDLPGLQAILAPAPIWSPPLLSARPELPLRPKHRIPLRDRMDLAIAHEVRMTRDPATGEVPRERLLVALDAAQEIRAEMQRA